MINLHFIDNSQIQPLLPIFCREAFQEEYIKLSENTPMFYGEGNEYNL